MLEVAIILHKRASVYKNGWATAVCRFTQPNSTNNADSYTVIFGAAAHENVVAAFLALSFNIGAVDYFLHCALLPAGPW